MKYTKEELKELQDRVDNNKEVLFIEGIKIVDTWNADAAYIWYKNKIEFVFIRIHSSNYAEEYLNDYEEEFNFKIHCNFCEVYNEKFRFCKLESKIEFLCYLDTDATEDKKEKYFVDSFDIYNNKYYRYEYSYREIRFYKTTIKQNNKGEFYLYLEGYEYKINVFHKTNPPEEDYYRKIVREIEHKELSFFMSNFVEISKETFDFVEQSYLNKIPLRIGNTPELKLN
jgi:hypothetical protein